MDSKKITATKGRLSEGLNKIANDAIDKSVPMQIEKAVDSLKIRTGVITKFYPYIDKAEVKLDYDNSKILCKILHRFGGDLIDFYTPLAYEENFDDELHEPYVVPRSSQNVCVLNIHDKDSSENLILGYYNNKEIVGFSPANPGNVRITNVWEDGNEYWINFGIDGFNYRVGKSPSRYVGNIHLEDGVKEFGYANQDEVYTKEEVSQLLEENEIEKYYVINSSNSKPILGEGIEITVKVYDNKVSKKPLSDYDFVLKISQNGIDFVEANLTTDNNGQAVYNYNCSTFGEVLFEVDFEKFIVDVNKTDWMEVEYANGYTRYNNDGGVFYRRVGDMVELNGEWTPSINSGTYPANTDGVTFAVIPSDYAPSKSIKLRMQGSDVNTYLLIITTDGELKWARYGTATSISLPYSVCGNVHTIWTI